MILKELARQAIRYGLKPEEIGPASTFTDEQYMKGYIGHIRGFESPASYGVAAIHRDRARKAWAKVFAEMKQGAAK
jgi:hypothetical protein